MNFFNKKPTVVFECEPELKGAIPDPIPANTAIPKWFRKIPDSTDVRTVKMCIPFKDAMGMGYILPLWVDLNVANQNNKVIFSYQSNNVLPSVFGDHSPQQIEGCPLRKTPYGDQPMKFSNPWKIKTPPGYSCMFIQPINHFDNRLHIITGVVDTDTYDNYVNFPFVWMDKEFNGLIPQGTPLVQVIPFKREEWGSSVSELSAESSMAIRKTVKTLDAVFRNAYRLNWWSPKRYK